MNAQRKDDLERARQWHPEKPEGLARTLARAGYGSRNRAAEIVRSGRVRLDGRVVVDPSAPVGPEQNIEFDGKPLVEATRRYFALHKPLRVICRPGEPGGYKLISEFFPRELPGLQVAGRLDGRTSGLILVSNDNQWNELAVGGRDLEKEYFLQIVGELNDMEIGIISAGVHLQNLGFIRPRSVQIVTRTVDQTTLRLVVRNGKNRQIRRMFNSLRHDVTILRRTRIGPIELGELSPGQMRELTVQEISAVRKLGGPGKAENRTA